MFCVSILFSEFFFLSDSSEKKNAPLNLLADNSSDASATEPKELRLSMEEREQGERDDQTAEESARLPKSDDKSLVYSDKTASSETELTPSYALASLESDVPSAGTVSQNDKQPGQMQNDDNPAQAQSLALRESFDKPVPEANAPALLSDAPEAVKVPFAVQNSTAQTQSAQKEESRPANVEQKESPKKSVPTLAKIEDIDLSYNDREKELTLRVTANKAFKAKNLYVANPERAILDLVGKWKMPKMPPFPTNPYCKGIRTGYSEKQTRFVVDIVTKKFTRTMIKPADNVVEYIVSFK